MTDALNVPIDQGRAIAMGTLFGPGPTLAEVIAS